MISKEQSPLQNTSIEPAVCTDSKETPTDMCNLTAVHAASVASQRHYQQLNAYWDRMYWIRETTRLYWDLAPRNEEN